MNRDLTCGGKYTIHFTDDMLQNYAPEVYNFATQYHSNKFNKKEKYTKSKN